jgi:hypothetical protein
VPPSLFLNWRYVCTRGSSTGLVTFQKDSAAVTTVIPLTVYANWTSFFYTSILALHLGAFPLVWWFFSALCRCHASLNASVTSLIIRGCIQMFPDWPPGARTANGTALYHKVQLCRYFLSQSSEFCRHNPLCCFSTSVYYCYCCCLFSYGLSPENFVYTLVYSGICILSSTNFVTRGYVRGWKNSSIEIYALTTLPFLPLQLVVL